MDWSAIICAIIGALAGGGLIGLICIKEIKKAKRLENQKTESEIKNSEEDQVLSMWKEIASEHKLQYEQMKVEVIEKDTRLDEKDEIISKLRDELDNTKTRCAVADIIKCRDLACENRKPKLGVKDDIDFV